MVTVPLTRQTCHVSISHPLEVSPVRCCLVILSVFSRDSLVRLLLGPRAHLRFGTKRQEKVRQKQKPRRTGTTCVGEEGAIKDRRCEETGVFSRVQSSFVDLLYCFYCGGGQSRGQTVNRSASSCCVTNLRRSRYEGCWPKALHRSGRPSATAESFHLISKTHPRVEWWRRWMHTSRAWRRCRSSSCPA